MSEENPERFQQMSAQVLDDKISEQECKSTKSDTKSHINLLKLFMKEAPYGIMLNWKTYQETNWHS